MQASPIIDLLLNETKVRIKQQLSHLNQLSADEPKSVAYLHMLDGARTVINLIKDEPIGNAGTDSYLNQLSRTQLEHAIKSANKILKTKSSQGKQVIYGVFSNAVDTKWFIRKACAQGYYIEAATESLNKKYPEVSMESRGVPVEELEEYLSKEDFDWYKKSTASDAHDLDDKS